MGSMKVAILSLPVVVVLAARVPAQEGAQLPGGSRAASILAARQDPENAPIFSISGAIVDVERHPIPSATVVLLHYAPAGAAVAAETTSDGNGRFTLSGAVQWWTKWRIEARAPRFAATVVDDLYVMEDPYDVGPVILFPPVLVSGRVTNEEDRAIGGAVVRVAPGEPGPDAPWFAERCAVTTTQPDGSWVVDTMPPGRCSIGVCAEGYADAVRSGVDLIAGEPNRFDLPLEKARPLVGRVVDADGAPVAGASVRAGGKNAWDGSRGSELPAFWRNAVETDREGRFHIDGVRDAASVSLQIRARGFAPIHVPPGRAGETDAPFVLERAHVLVVRVERDDGSPPPAILSVDIRDVKHPHGGCGWYEQFAWSLITYDPEFVERIEPHVWRIAWTQEPTKTSGGRPESIQVTADDGSQSERIDIAPNAANDGLTEVVVRVPRAASVAGRAVDAFGRPLAGVCVRLQPHFAGSLREMRAISGADGSFRFECVGARGYVLYVKDADWWTSSDRWIDLEPGSALGDVALLVHRPPRINGRLTIDGRSPGEGIPIGLGEMQEKRVLSWGPRGLGTTAADGSFSIIPTWPRAFSFVPKRPIAAKDGGYRRFRDEFPDKTTDEWDWIASAPAKGETQFDLDLPLDWADSR